MKEFIPNQTPVELLLIDDDDKDIFLTKRAFKKSKTPNKIQIAKDGEEGLALLRREKPYETAARPDLILLDLNMPRMSGYELLEIIKSDDDLKSIPVIVMTMSQSDVDMMKSYRRHASSFISKPIELDDFMAVIRAIEDFWFIAVSLPQHRDV